jgi:glucokinase
MSAGANILESVRYPVLVGDIGGTNGRFALLTGKDATLISFPNVRTADYPNIDDAIRGAILPAAPKPPKTAVLAIAGPINSNEIELTNCPWVVRPKVMMETLGFEEVIVLNDFEAQALAVVALDKEHLEQIGGGDADPVAGRVVLGPGTGLGVAGLINARGVWQPIPGEGGHVDVGPRSARDFEIFPHLEPIEGRISAEQILCGRGMLSLYRAICMADGVSPQFSEPHEITAGAMVHGNRRAKETLSLFAAYLGRVAGDMALVFMAKGGVYLSGGIAQKILPVLKQGEFRAAFNDKAPHSEMMSKMPVFVMTHQLAAVMGLAAFARNPFSFGVNMNGRHWQS